MIHLIAAFAIMTPAETLYTQALQHMKSELQPMYATYTANLEGQGVNLELLRTAQGLPSLKVSSNEGAPRVTADIVYSYVQHRTSIKMPDGTTGDMQSPFFSATWLGAYDWLRYGQDGTTPAVAPSAQPTAEPTPEIPVIAVVASLGTGNYRVEDGGDKLCPSGEAGHAVHLVAKFDPDRHPLTDAVVSQSSGGFCMMRFRKPFTSLHPTYTGVLEFHFKHVSGYTVISDERMDFTTHILGVMKKSFSINATYSNFALPTSPPAN